jgi:two-component system, OmpR family, sensor histidine kinase KdpD
MNPTNPIRRQPLAEVWHVAGAIAALAIVTAAYEVWLGVSNPTVVGLSYLLIVLLVAAVSTPRVAIGTSLLALLALNYFFMPPVGTFRLEDPQNWVALLVFLTVSVVGSRLSLMARSRADEALARRDELGRLFDLSRDILLTTDSREVIDELARHMARRFGFDYVGICLPEPDGWRVHASSDAVTLERAELDKALAKARGALEFDAYTRSYGGHFLYRLPDGLAVTLVPLRLGMRAVGLLAATGRTSESGTLDAIAGLTAIAIERAKMLEERRDAERVREGAELKTALLASLGHDLKTPLTAITVAAGNLRAAGTTDELRRDQLDVIRLEVSRLNRLFQNIVDMARIETGAIDARREWVHPAEIVDAAIQQVQHALENHPLELDVDTPGSVQVDPRLTSAALAHLLENAGQYAPAGTPVTITARLDEAGLTLSVRDRGPGIAPQDLEHLFEQFFRGAGAQQRSFGTGMGLAITKGLLAAEGGRAWAENHPDGGACFTLSIPTPIRQGNRLDEEPS